MERDHLSLLEWCIRHSRLLYIHLILTYTIYLWDKTQRFDAELVVSARTVCPKAPERSHLSTFEEAPDLENSLAWLTPALVRLLLCYERILFCTYRGVSPEMDGENNGTFPIKNGMICGVFTHYFWKHSYPKRSIHERDEFRDAFRMNRCGMMWCFLHMGLEPQTTIYKWMFGETTISQVKIWNHPLETTIKIRLFRVPGGAVFFFFGGKLNFK